MKRAAMLAVIIGTGLCFPALMRGDEIQFITLPQVVQTSVIRETRIASPANVIHVIRQDGGVYAVTVRGDTGERVVYVNEAGAIVESPATSTTIEKNVQLARPVEQTTETVVTYDQVQKSESRYELIEKKGKKEVYLDKQTGQKVIVKREDD
jgi:hypothetical protein